MKVLYSYETDNVKYEIREALPDGHTSWMIVKETGQELQCAFPLEHVIGMAGALQSFMKCEQVAPIHFVSELGLTFEAVRGFIGDNHIKFAEDNHD